MKEHVDDVLIICRGNDKVLQRFIERINSLEQHITFNMEVRNKFLIYRYKNICKNNFIFDIYIDNNSLLFGSNTKRFIRYDKI